MMPRELTAGNGAKAALIGEFSIDFPMKCCCHGEQTDCNVCGGSGEYVQPINVPWTTIKEIFKAAVKHLGEDLTDVLPAVVAERARQDGKWGGPQVDDARKTQEDWCNDIEAYAVWARQMHRMGSPDKYRRRMLQIAALAVAACESFDRNAAQGQTR